MATFPQNLALICLTVSEKMRFTDAGRRTDDGRKTDARATALALLTQSSRAKNVCMVGKCNSEMYCLIMPNKASRRA